MSEPDLLPLLLGPSGVVVLVLLILYGGRKKWWVFGWYAQEVVKERDEWKELALRGTKIAEVVTTALPAILRNNGDTQ